MVKYILIALFFISGLQAVAAPADSLFAARKGAAWVIKYTVKPRETIHMLAQRFYLTDANVESVNEADNTRRVVPGTIINIPVMKDNYFVSKPPLDMSDMQEIYYRVGPKDDIGLISTYAGTTKNDMRSMNSLHGNTLTIGQTLFVGWVKMMAPDSTNPATEVAYPAFKKAPALDTAKMRVPGGLDTIFNRQTNNGINVLTEKGTAVFFEKPGKNNVYYAFHNATPRNSVIKVFNPGTGKTIYVKVLGPLPDTKLYSGSIIGISNAAKEALGVTDNKAWCELSYYMN
jgi:hypothetical protein